LVKGQRYPKALQPIIDHIKPRDIAVFHGYINMNKMNFFEKFVFKKTPDMIGDFRDWNAIEAWANIIAADLKKVKS
jgi:menaquinone-dependent protoporphyrinogen oxidase